MAHGAVEACGRLAGGRNPALELLVDPTRRLGEVRLDVH
jgi:hypothetical protein